MSKPIVASYCTTFLKPEMLHIYRQVANLERYETFIVAKERQCEDKYPFEAVEILPRQWRKNFIRRFYMKHIQKLPPIYYRGEMQEMEKIFARRRADLVHIYFGHTGVHLLPFVERWEKPCVVSFHGADVMLREKQAGYADQMRRLLQIVPLVLVRSISLADRLAEIGCPPEKIRLNRTGFPLSDFPFAQRLMPADGEWRFIQTCRLIPKKGLRTALQAFARFRKTYPKAAYTIVGEGPMLAELEKLVVELGLAGAVNFPGFLGKCELNALYSRSHVFLHPSEMTEDKNQEGIPNSMLEAMSTGLPVVATLHGGIPEAVQHERTGFLVPERDPEALSAAMAQITESSEYLQVMGKQASQSVHAEFEQSRAIKSLEASYDEAIKIGQSLPRAAR